MLLGLLVADQLICTAWSAISALKTTWYFYVLTSPWANADREEILLYFKNLRRGVSPKIESREEQQKTSNKKPPNPTYAAKASTFKQRDFSWTSIIRRHSWPWDSTKLSQEGRPILWPPRPLLHSRSIFGSVFFGQAILVFSDFLSSTSRGGEGRKKRKRRNYTPNVCLKKM